MFLTNAPLLGEKHVTGILLVAFIIYLLLHKVKKINYNQQKSHILHIMILFYLLEITKISYTTITSGSFPMNQLPFQLCSLPLYIYPIMYFSKKDAKILDYLKPAAYGIVLISGICALIMASTIIGSELRWLPLSKNVLPIISFTYHGLMIYSALFLLKSGYYTFKISDYKKAIITAIPLLLAALLTNHFLGTDYMALSRGSGVPFAFLIETSQTLYTSLLILLGFLGVHIVFKITDSVINHNKLHQKSKHYS